MKKKFVIEIEVDEKNIAEKYPNYSINYGSPEELIDSIIEDIKFCADTDMSKDGLEKFGYAIRIIDTGFEADMEAQDEKWGKHKV